MGTRRRSGCARLVGVLALLASFLAPLTFGEHHHASLDPVRDCATCVVVHHSQAEAGAPVVHPVRLVSRPLAAPALPPTLLATERPAHAGRGPPVPVGL